MDSREYFDSVAYRWDSMCTHDDKKLKSIIKLSSVCEDARILDVGTGTGILISYLLDTNPCRITAVDISRNMIEVARKKYHDTRVSFVTGDIMEYNDSGYDYAFIYSAYPHFRDREGLFKHIWYLLEPGGRVVVAHSESREKINGIHRKDEIVKNDVLPVISVTSGIMSRYFDVEKTIDNDDMYYICAVKPKYDGKRSITARG